MRGGFGDPLFVIDGVIRDKEAFDLLEPYEIDQMSFLKMRLPPQSMVPLLEMVSCW